MENILKTLFVVILILLPFTITLSSNYESGEFCCQYNNIKKLQPYKSTDTQVKIPDQLDKLINALITVESGGNDSIIGDTHLPDGYSIGALQIRPVMVREVNRILELKNNSYRFTLNDRYDRNKSIQMFHIWREFHHKNSTIEKIARNWNGGPNGYKKSVTMIYWDKVQKVMKTEGNLNS